MNLIFDEGKVYPLLEFSSNLKFILYLIFDEGKVHPLLEFSSKLKFIPYLSFHQSSSLSFT
jgi:hypothetical protein